MGPTIEDAYRREKLTISCVQLKSWIRQAKTIFDPQTAVDVGERCVRLVWYDFAEHAKELEHFKTARTMNDNRKVPIILVANKKD